MKIIKALLLVIILGASNILGYSVNSKENLEIDLVNAVKVNDIKVVEKLIRDGVDVNIGSIQDKNIAHPLTYSISKTFRNLEIAKLLLKNGANVNLSNKGLRTFQVAVAGLDIEVMKLLLDNGADINIKLESSMSPLMSIIIADKFSDKEILPTVDFLLQNGADVNFKENHGITALMMAVLEARYEIVKLLIDRGAQINSIDLDGNTPLFYSTESKNNLNIAKLLIENGADVNVQNAEGYTPLMFAVNNGNKSLVDLLLNTGAQVNLKDKQGLTALDYTDSLEIKKMLIKNQ